VHIAGSAVLFPNAEQHDDRALRIFRTFGAQLGRAQQEVASLVADVERPRADLEHLGQGAVVTARFEQARELFRLRVGVELEHALARLDRQRQIFEVVLVE
jgi:hypothetical protein